MNKDRAIEIFKNIRNDDNILHFTHEEHLQALDYAIEQMEWHEFNHDSQDLLKDHYFYLVAHKDYKTPMKAKWHDDGLPSFEVYIGVGKTNEYVSVFDETVTHWKEIDELPKVEPYVRSEE